MSAPSTNSAGTRAHGIHAALIGARIGGTKAIN
jgi:hypothetical protein